MFGEWMSKGRFGLVKLKATRLALEFAGCTYRQTMGPVLLGIRTIQWFTLPLAKGSPADRGSPCASSSLRLYVLPLTVPGPTMRPLSSIVTRCPACPVHCKHQHAVPLPCKPPRLHLIELASSTARPPVQHGTKPQGSHKGPSGC